MMFALMDITSVWGEIGADGTPFVWLKMRI